MGTAITPPLIIDKLASGYQPPAYHIDPNIVGLYAKTQADLAQRQADLEQVPSEIAQRQALTQAIQTQTQGVQLDTALKQRNLDAMQKLGGILQQNTTKNADGSTSVNWGNTIGQLATAGYPDYAFDLQQKHLEREKTQTEVAKSQYDLNMAQLNHQALMGGMAGFDNPNIANDPQVVKKYSNFYNQAQQSGSAQGLPTPEDFAKNPAAYTSQFAQKIQNSGQMTAVMAARKQAITDQQASMEQARKTTAQLLENAKTPEDYAAVYNKVNELFPSIFPQLNLRSPDMVNSPALVSFESEAARRAAMPAVDAQKANEQTKVDAADISLKGAQAIEAGTAATKNVAEAGKANVESAVSGQTFKQTFGVDPVTGKPIKPNSPGAAQGGSIVDQWVNGVIDNPDSFKDVPVNLKGIVGSRLVGQNLHIPVPLPSEVANNEASAYKTVAFVNDIRQLLQDPKVANNVGIIAGRVGNLSQKIGADFSNDPQTGQKLQKLRTMLNTLFTSEMKTNVGGRAAEGIMKQFEAASATPDKAMNLLQGSLDATESAAHDILTAGKAIRQGALARGEGPTPPQVNQQNSPQDIKAFASKYYGGNAAAAQRHLNADGTVTIKAPDGRTKKVAIKDVDWYAQHTGARVQ